MIYGIISRAEIAEALRASERFGEAERMRDGWAVSMTGSEGAYRLSIRNAFSRYSIAYDIRERGKVRAMQRATELCFRAMSE